VDKAESEDQDILGNKQECSFHSDMGCFDRFVVVMAAQEY